MQQRILYGLYGSWLTLVGAVVFTTQVLGFIGQYQARWVLPGTLLVWLVLGTAYFRTGRPWSDQVMRPANEPAAPNWLPGWVAGAAWFLLVVVFLQRMALYPLSNLGLTIPSDALGYHFIKAIELARTGTLWDLSLLYGEYPTGYESLIALGVLLTGTVYPIGSVHLLNLLLLVLTLTLLLCRYTRLPVSLGLLVSVGLFFYPDLYSQTLLIGKNDLFLSMALLAALLHSPLGRRDAPPVFHPVGLACATLIAMCAKANGVVLPALLWLLVLFYAARAWQRGQLRAYLAPLTLGTALVIMLPGGFWVLRNLAIMGRPFSPEVSTFFGGSIIANLGDPRLFTSGGDSLALIGLSLWLIVLAGLIDYQQMLTRWLALLLLVLWGIFFITPLGAFHTPQKTVVHIEWRYTTHTFLLMAVMCAALAERWLQRGWQIAMRWPRLTAAACIVGCAGLIVAINPGELMQINRDHLLRWRDPYPAAIGSAGYRSAYDYVQREIRHSTLIYNGGLAFYLYDPGYTNHIRSAEWYPLGMPDLLPRPMPDYLVYFNRSDPIQPGHGAAFDPLPGYTWKTVYEDRYGVVYRRISPAP